MVDTVPILTFYRHGGKGGVAPMKNGHARAKRGDVGGWSLGATRRNTEFLYSIREDRLTGVGFAVTLTLRDCPPDSLAWHRLRRRWMDRLRRAGALRVHWVTEWQRRGVPHIHAAVYFPESDVVAWDNDLQCRVRVRAPSWLVRSWLECGASKYGAGSSGQFVLPIAGAVGWFQYVSKHAARGVRHYQRSAENVPDAWKLRTGRVWGKLGDWPVQEGVRVAVEGSEGDGGFYPFRRIMRAWRVADARASGDRIRIRLARGMLRCKDRALSAVRGYNEWVPAEVQSAALANIASRGYAIRYGDREDPVDYGLAMREADQREDEAFFAEYLDAPSQ